MKKFMTLAAMFAVTMMSFSACQPEDKPTPKPETPDTPGTETPETPEGVDLGIVIDGDFADWDNVPAEHLASATCQEGATYTALKAFKVCSDELYINVYFEYDVEQVVDLSWTPIHLYFNADNSAETGGGDAAWSDADAEVMLEGVFAADGDLISFDPAKFHWWGEVGATGWSWTDPNETFVDGDGKNWGADMPEGSGISEGAGVAAEGKYELQILKEMVQGAQWADTFTVGMDVQQNWSTVGQLPNASGEGVTCTKLVVNVAK